MGWSISVVPGRAFDFRISIRDQFLPRSLHPPLAAPTRKDITMSVKQTLRLATPIRPLLVVVASAALAACASAAAVRWPASLEPTAGETWSATLYARGVQIYECRGNATASAWAFVAPEAELFDDARRLVGSHGAGPFWLSIDGSRVEGSVKARADAPVADAIPWLLLSSRSTGLAGRFSPVTSIRRVHTVGGNAPRGGCGPETLGSTARVPYSADYIFYTPR
jgi:hypothetical protein